MNKKISKYYYSSDWSSDLADRHSKEWVKAIEIINDRFSNRYIKPINELINHPEKSVRTNIGFIVMSIDCLLIETLNQFYFGLKDTSEKYYKRNQDANYRYQSQSFRDFFEYSTYFPLFKGNLELSRMFYDEIRCGLLHQAESKANSLINIKAEAMVTPVDGQDIKNGIIINRDFFHKALSNEFDKYISDLSNPESINLEGKFLREMCNNKMKELIK